MNLHFKQEKTKIFAPKPESIDLIKLTTAFPQCKVNISHEDQDINGASRFWEYHLVMIILS